MVELQCIKEEMFLSLTSTAWSAISAITTFLAVLVALFLPFYYERKKKINLSNLIEVELARNFELLNKANSVGTAQINGQPISRCNLMYPYLAKLDLSVWSENKKTVAEISSNRYLKYSYVTDLIKNIHEHAVEINAKNGESVYIATIEKEVEQCLRKMATKE
jgi:hypothetical protein